MPTTDGPSSHVSRRRTSQVFAPEARNERCARQMVADRLDAWGMTAERPSLELAVSELFANAILHGDGTVGVTLSADHDLIRLEVRDEGGGEPELQPPDPTGTRVGGWGLRLVDQLADAWGSEVSETATVVWMERRHRPAAASAPGTSG